MIIKGLVYWILIKYVSIYTELNKIVIYGKHPKRYVSTLHCSTWCLFVVHYIGWIRCVLCYFLKKKSPWKRPDHADVTWREYIPSNMHMVNTLLCFAEFWYMWIYISIRVTLLALTLQWHHNGHDCVSNHQPHRCLLNLFYSGADQRKNQSTAVPVFV